MTKKLLFVTSLLLALVLAVFAADVTGKWTYEQAGRQGGAPTVVTLDLKASGSTLTGTVSRPGRGGNQDSPIADGKIDGNNISFTTSRDMGGQTMKTEYTGTVSGSEIKLKILNPGRGGGAPTPVEVVAKKATT